MNEALSDSVDVRDLHVVMTAGWPGLEQARLGDWVLRAGAGHTHRANSALPLGSSGLPVEDAVERVTDWYRHRGLRPVFQIPSLGADAVDEHLQSRGWRLVTPTQVMVATLSALEPTELPEGLSWVWADEPDDAWLARYGEGRAVSHAARDVLTASPANYLSLRTASGDTVGIGRLSTVAGWAGLSCIELDESLRGQGLGRAITGALLTRGSEWGAARAYLQVVAENARAIGLYASEGFVRHSSYHYRALGD